MPKLSEQAMINKHKYDVKYAKENFKCKNLPFNMKNPDDAILLDWIKKQPEGGNAYIKRVVREDMERRANENQ